MLNDDHVLLINEIHFRYYFDEKFFLENQFLKIKYLQQKRNYFLFSFKKPFCFSFNSFCCCSTWISCDLSTFNKAIYCWCWWCIFVWLLFGLCTIWNALFSFTVDDIADFGLERRLSNIPKSCSIIWIGVRDERFCSIKNDIGNESSLVFILLLLLLLLLLLFTLADGNKWGKCECFFFSEDFIDDADDDDDVAKPLVLLCTVWKWPDVDDDDNDEVTAEGTRKEMND